MGDGHAGAALRGERYMGKRMQGTQCRTYTCMHISEEETYGESIALALHSQDGMG